MAQALPPSSHSLTLAASPVHASAAPTARHAALPWVGLGAACLFVLLTIDALLFAPDRAGSADLRLMIQVQRIDLPYLGPSFEFLGKLTDSGGAVGAWLVTLAVYALLRWWLSALAVFSLPLGGVINETVSRLIVERTRPHGADLRHQSLNFEERSFPSGHVVGAVLLYGLIWYVAARRIGSAPLRRLIQIGCGAVILLSGLDRVWSGAHWPTDVIGAYALGVALLVSLILASEWVEREAAWIAADRAGPRPQLASWPLGLELALLPFVRVIEMVLTRHRWLAVRLARQPGGVAHRPDPPPP